MMQNNKKIVVGGFLAAVMISMIFMAGGIKTTLAQGNPMIPSATDQGANSSNATTSMSGMNMSSTLGGGGGNAAANKTTVARDSVTVLLEGKTIPGKGFIHLYDSTPYMINAGHIALHVPCDANSKPAVNVLIGSAPNVKPVEPDLIKELSQAGQMCIYHVDVDSDPAKKVYQTDIAIQNPSNQTITFPATSGVVIGVNEVQPGVPGG
jgi:hypothetical protein